MQRMAFKTPSMSRDSSWGGKSKTPTPRKRVDQDQSLRVSDLRMRSVSSRLIQTMATETGISLSFHAFHVLMVS
jgi:hypothetical protein